MKDVRMIVLVRNDKKIKRGELMNIVSDISMKFLFENNESDRSDRLFVNLSLEEALWIKEGMKREIGWASEGELEELLFKSQVHGLPSYVLRSDEKGSEGPQNSILGIAFGPAEFSDISTIVGHYKKL